MKKILLIIQREYVSRVKKKSFILMTFLVPLLFIGMWGIAAYIAVKGDEFGDKKHVKVIDESGLFTGRLQNKSGFEFSYPKESFADAKKALEKSEDENDYLLHIPADGSKALLLSRKTTSLNTVPMIQDQLSGIMQNKKLISSGIDTATLARAQEVNVPVEAHEVTEEGEKDASHKAEISTAIGFVCAFMIYLSLFIYGTQVMRGVIEEKTSRIVEVVISSVKPIQLMLGKIIGIGLVGLTQFLLWIILSAALTFGGGGVALMSKMNKSKMEQVANAQKMQQAGNSSTAAMAMAGNNPDMKEKMMTILKEQHLPYTIGIFLFYFLFGYFLYSAIFAAVGSAVDNETETQQFMLPVTLPLIFTFILSMNFIVANPHSSLAVWLSMIPFTAPIAMMIRLPFNVPTDQLVLSMTFMVLGFLFVTWVAARIYRVGILMYGKKASYKELAKWFFYKE